MGFMVKEGKIEEQPEWVITVIGREDAPTEGVVALVAGMGMRVDRIQDLAGNEKDLEIKAGRDWKKAGYRCQTVWVSGELGDQEANLRLGLAQLGERFALDLAIQRRAEYQRERRLFCFDMDSTLIQGEVIDELAKMAGVADRVVAITAEAMRGEIEFQESFRRRVKLLEGLPLGRVHELLERIPLMEGAERLFRNLQKMGAKTAILSGGFTFFGAHLKERLGVDYVFANELEVDASGYVSGEVTGRIVDGARKAELLEEIARWEGVPLEQVVAVGDGANDLPMLRLAGMGVAFHAKPVVRAEAGFSMTHVGLDGLLYLLGVAEREWIR